LPHPESEATKYLCMRKIGLWLVVGSFALHVYAQGSRPDVNYDESKIPPYTLPELLKTEKGEKITTAKEWEKKRRPELYQLFRDEMYGAMPEGKINQKFTVININKNFADGLATHKTVEIWMSRGDKSHKATIHVYTPNAVKKVPMFMYFSGKQKEPKDWFIKLMKAGYGLCTGDNNEFFPDRPEDPTVYNESVLSLWGYENENDLPKNACRALGVWAWAHSRALDYLEKDKDVDAKRVVVMGHSRGGKLAAWAAASDERFAVAILNNSGCGGAALFRRKIGETAYRINLSFPYWFCGNFHKYSWNEDKLPVDQHGLIALIAPRPVYVGSAVDDYWADPKGEFLSIAHAEKVFNLYNYKGVQTMMLPPLNTPVGDRAAYHIRIGGHTLTDYDWEKYIQFANKWLKK